MNRSKKAKFLRETSREEAFKGFAYLHPKSLNESTLAAFIRKATKFPLQQEEIDKFVSEHKPEVTE
jgi:hypothetical protein